MSMHSFIDLRRRLSVAIFTYVKLSRPRIITWLVLVEMREMVENHVLLEQRQVFIFSTTQFLRNFFFQEAAVMIVTVSLIVGAVLAILGYLAKKYGKCKWLAACISAREVDAENQKVQKNPARKS